MRAALKEYITNPVVTVIVVETTPRRWSTSPAKSTSPGRSAADGPMSVAAGAGDGRRLHGLRQQEGHPDPAQGSAPACRRCKFNYNDAIEGNGDPLLLKPGDTVIVP